jgi:branched-subunit amino acid transport protein
MINLSASQLSIVGLAATVLVYLIRLIYEIAAKERFSIPDWVQIVLVYVVSFVLAVLWFPQTLPALPVLSADPTNTVMVVLTYVGQLLAMLTTYAVSATAIYVLILNKVKVALGQKLTPTLYPAS